MAERIYGQYEDADGRHGVTREDVQEMSREDQVRLMVDWFHAHFEDPAHRTPYESAEGGYQWIWGGPHSADEELQDEFSQIIDFEIIQEAVQEIESDGLYEWAPTVRPGDYDDRDDDDGVQSGAIVDGDDGEWPPIIAENQPLPSESEARQQVVRRLDALEDLIRPLVSPHGMMGHNQPPEPLEVEHPCTPEEWLALKADVDALRQQAQQVTPDEAEISRATGRISRLGTQLMVWIGKRVEKGIDAAVVACGTAGGVSVVVNLDAIVASMGELVNAASVWLQTIPWPF